MMYSRRSHGKRDAEEEMPGAYVGPGALGDGWRPALDEFGERNGSRWAMFRLTLGGFTIDTLILSIKLYDATRGLGVSDGHR